MMVYTFFGEEKCHVRWGLIFAKQREEILNQKYPKIPQNGSTRRGKSIKAKRGNNYGGCVQKVVNTKSPMISVFQESMTEITSSLNISPSVLRYCPGNYCDGKHHLEPCKNTPSTSHYTS